MTDGHTLAELVLPFWIIFLKEVSEIVLASIPTKPGAASATNIPSQHIQME